MTGQEKTLFRGKKYITSKLTEKKLRINKEELEFIKNKKYIDRYFYNKKSGEVLKFNLKSIGKDNDLTFNPTLSKEFGTKKRISNKELINLDNQYNKNKKLNVVLYNDSIPWGVPVKLLYEVQYYIEFPSSGRRYPKKQNEYITEIIGENDKMSFDNKNELYDYVHSLLSQTEEFMKLLKKSHDFDLYIHRVLAITENYAVMRPLKMGLRENKPLKINLFNCEIQIKDNKMNNCVKNLLYQLYYKEGKGISKATINNLGNNDAVSVKDITNFCKEYNIKTIAYDINKNVISEYIPEKINKTYKSLIYIAYNNHIYPIHNAYLTKNKEPKYKSNVYISFIEMENKLIETLESGILPDNISIIDRSYNDNNNNEIPKLGISSFIIDNVLYHSNEEYNKVCEISKLFGISDKIDPKVNLSNIGDYIEKLYLKNCVKSFFPYEPNFNGGYNYVNEDYEKLAKKYNTITIDNNKHYSNALHKLPFLIKTDIRTCKHRIIKDIDINEIEIKDDNLYVANPKVSTILMPVCDYYAGYQLKYCTSQGIKYELLEELEAEQIPNYYKSMIDDLLTKVDETTFKDIINRHIGRMYGNWGENIYKKFSKIANNDEVKCSKGYVYKLTKDYNLIYETKTSFHDIYNKRPIRQQILFEARKIIYEKMKELELSNNMILQIKTDAITFANKNNIIINSSSKFGEWKIETKEKPTPCPNDIFNEIVSFNTKPINDINTIWIDYAGSGKTHYIINELLPKIKENDLKSVFSDSKDNYIILTPSHSACKDYRKNKINCSVIQKYTYTYNNIPDEEYIIVDEIGMVDKQGLDLLIKATIMGKKIYAFGDYQQLPPVSCGIALNNPIFLNLLYSNQKSLGTNYRNNFSKEYYDYLIHETNNEKLIKQVEKYNYKSWKKAEIIICYTNTTRRHYNKLMLEYLGLEKFDIGARIVCKSNDLAEDGIYNNFYYTIKNKTDEYITITDDEDDINVELKNLKYFNSGYCRTVYNIQGESIKSFYYAPEDYKFLDGKTTYTVISRLKQDKHT